MISSTRCTSIWATMMSPVFSQMTSETAICGLARKRRVSAFRVTASEWDFDGPTPSTPEIRRSGSGALLGPTKTWARLVFQSACFTHCTTWRFRFYYVPNSTRFKVGGLGWGQSASSDISRTWTQGIGHKRAIYRQNSAAPLGIFFPAGSARAPLWELAGNLSEQPSKRSKLH